MRSAIRRVSGRSPVLLTLAACTAWLAVQNTILIALFFWWNRIPEAAVAAQALVRAVLLAGAQLLPVAGVIVATVVVAGIGAVLLVGPPPSEARHG